MTYELVKTDTDLLYLDGTIQYVFKKKLHTKTWYVNYNTVTNSIESVICSGSWGNFQHRKHCIPKEVNQFIGELKLAAIL